jgi:hypothetical protein
MRNTRHISISLSLLLRFLYDIDCSVSVMNFFFVFIHIMPILWYKNINKNAFGAAFNVAYHNKKSE